MTVAPLISIPELSVEIYAAPLPGQSRGSRRQAETTTAAELVKAIFGDGASISHFPSGAPCLSLPGVETIPTISVSHSLSTLLLAVGRDRQSIGVDIETPRPNLERVARRFLRPEELGVHDTSLPALLRAWTAKEAAFKAIGVFGTMLADISLSPDASSATLPAYATPPVAIRHYRGPGDSLIALAVANH